MTSQQKTLSPTRESLEPSHDHEPGLEVCLEPSHDHEPGLEVCHDHEAKAPEVVLSRSQSQQSPEPIWPHVPPDKKDSGQNHYDSTKVLQADVTRKLRRRRWTLAMFIIGATIVMAAVLGGVLPAVLHHQTRDSSASGTQAKVPLAVYNGSGIAIVVGSEQTYGYLQDRSGAVLEREIINSPWEASTPVTEDAAPGSPLAAIELPMYGIRYRLLFFLDSNGQLMMTNRTSPGPDSWTAPVSVLANKATWPNTKALDMVNFPGISDDFPVTLRVYYGSSTTGVSEIGIGGASFYGNSFNGYSISFLNDSDSGSGVAATNYNRLSHIYVRNMTSAGLNQWSFGYGDLDTNGWNNTGRTFSSDPPVANGSSIAACNDESGAGTDYIFYQTTNGSIVSMTSSVVGFSTARALQPALARSQLRAWYNNSSSDPGAVLFYQTGQGTLGYLQLSRASSVVTYGVVESIG